MLKVQMRDVSVEIPFLLSHIDFSIALYFASNASFDLGTRVFAVSQFYRFPGSHLSWLVLSESVVLPGEP